MKAEDLLRAFQSVETDIADAAEYKRTEPAGAEGTTPAEQIMMHTDSERQPRIYTAAGIAAAVVIGCIAYLGFAAIHNENMQAASQPKDVSAIVTEMAEDENKVPLQQRTRAVGSSIRYLGQVVGESDEDPRAELSTEGTPEPFALDMTCWIEDYDGTITERIVLMQDGEVIPFALTKNGKPEEYHDFTLQSKQQAGIPELKSKLTQEIWLMPKHDYEYSRLYCLYFCYSPDDIVIGADSASVSLHCTDAQPAESEPSCATASYETDYVDYPADARDYGSLSHGVGIGKYLDYQKNIPHRYEIDNLSFFASAFRRDTLYARMHLPESPDSRYRNAREVTDDVYLTVLCDGKPCKAFDGKDSLRIAMPPADKSLCYPLTLEEAVISDGWHHLVIFALGSSHSQHGTNERKPYSASNYQTAPPRIHIETADGNIV
ncbi:MAG: hypothetical protein MJ065_02335 [Oscillospiraceae bacterium]|nr:hypothetical protein [Oscillospiraceae bacterium]